MKTQNLSVMLLNIVLYILSILLSINSFTNASLILNILNSVLLIYGTLKISGNYTNYSLFFITFSFIYGLSGPVNALWGGGLPAIFSTSYHIDEFLVAYALANVGYILGIIIYNLLNKNNLKAYSKRVGSCFEIVNKNHTIIINTAIILAFIGTIFEIINMMRIGGVTMLLTGKANYQGISSQLTLTLPSTIIINLAFSFLSLYISCFYVCKKRINIKQRRKVVLFFLLAVPYLLINVILGKRGVLLTLFIIIFIGITYFKPIKKIKPKLFILVVVFYICLSFLFANRARMELLFKEPKTFFDIAFESERIVRALNPGSNEFGAAFGNFSEYYKKYGVEFEPRFGSTYIKGLVVPIPSFLYPGKKPKQITYEFRDEFFPSEAKRSSIAGTGFSSILEAYINFKYIGVFLIYFIIGCFLQAIDIKYKYRNLILMILYISLISQTIYFHRSAFGSIFGSIILSFVVILFMSLAITILKKQPNKLKHE